MTNSNAAYQLAELDKEKTIGGGWWHEGAQYPADRHEQLRGA
jgi:hypothetical protein